jgi:spermidine synthase
MACYFAFVLHSNVLTVVARKKWWPQLTCRYRVHVHRSTRHFAATLLFLSGATGLVYELCWSKRLANLLGNSGQAHAIVLAVFMGGLALGAFFGGSLADRLKRPLVLYGALELGVAFWALAFPSVMALVQAIFLSAAPHVGTTERTAIHLFLAGAALVPPTLMMGGTLPAMMQAVTVDLSETQRALAKLYAVNSAGAAVGTLLAGLVLVPASGIVASERAAAFLNLLVAIAACARGLIVAPLRRPPQSQHLTGPLQYSSKAVTAALGGTAIAGFVSMLYEITWIRLLSIVIGGTSYAFTLIVAAFIVGIAAGSAWLARQRVDANALSTFGWLQLGLVTSVAVGTLVYSRLPYLFIHLQQLLQHGPQSFGPYQLASFGFCVALVLPPTFLLGASFPSAARVALSAHGRLGKQLGRVYLFNTIGTVSGGLLTGLALLPRWGLESTLRFGLLVNVVALALVLWGQGVRKLPLRQMALALTAVLVVSFAATQVGWAQQVVSAGRWREWKQSFASFEAFSEAVRSRATVDFMRDDVFASVMVGSEGPNHRFLRINGKADGSNGDDADTQSLAAHLGVLLRQRPVKRVLLVGLGTGITAGALLAHPIEHLDVVEISPAVVDAARLFADDNNRALDDPRCHLHLDDARSFLALAQMPYDLIVSVPSNPWVSGVAGLYTTDFFALAKTKLAADGHLVQWIHTYETTSALIELVFRTVRSQFPHGTTWVGPDDLVLVMSPQPQRIVGETIEARMQVPSVAASLARVKVHFVETLLARQLHSDSGQARLAGHGVLNTDDLNLLEYGSPLGYFIGDRVPMSDERGGAQQGETLAIAAWLASRPLTIEKAQDIVRNLQWVYDPDAAVLRGATEAWHALAPHSAEAALALAEVALAQSDVPAAHAALSPFMGPDANARLWAHWLAIRRAELRRSTGPWHVVDVSADLVSAQEALTRAPPGADAEALRDAVAALEASW